MKRYRMQVNAVLCFDVEAEDEAGAVKAAEEACSRLSEGIEADDPDPEDVATDVVAYPTESPFPLDPKVLEVADDDD